MATIINQKVANPSILGNSTTGTGNIVLSESPTINNPNLTGSVSANVNLRSGTLSTLLPLAGGASEIGYATDANALVRFNGSAGQAQVVTGGATLNFRFTLANVAQYTNGGASYIDCKNINTLNLSQDPAVYGSGYTINSINIRFPSVTTTFFTVNLTDAGGSPYYGAPLDIIPAFQPGESTVTYSTIQADNNFDAKPRLDVSIAIANVSIKFFSGTETFSRYPCLELTEGQLNAVAGLTTVSTGYNFPISPSTTSLALTSGTIRNLGNFTIPSNGIWMITGLLSLTTTTNLVASKVSGGVALNEATDTPDGNTNTFNLGRMTTCINLPAGTTTEIALPTVVELFGAGQVLYQNAYAVFSAGTISANIRYRVTKLV
jgi:hypothetical protein